MTVTARFRSVATDPPHQGAPGLVAYEDDYHGWAIQQASLLAAGDTESLDLANLAEEVAELARAEFRCLADAYRLLLLRVLKWDLAPAKRTLRCRTAIEIQRDRVKDLCLDNPSLSRRLDEASARGYREARLRVSRELALPLDQLPETCPYGALATLSRRFDLG
jgi:hypothetical protein